MPRATREDIGKRNRMLCPFAVVFFVEVLFSVHLRCPPERTARTSVRLFLHTGATVPQEATSHGCGVPSVRRTTDAVDDMRGGDPRQGEMAECEGL